MTDLEPELERTYLARNIPGNIHETEPLRLSDIYVPEAGTPHPRLRIRKKGGAFEITKKVPVSEGDASAHIEKTIELSELEFSALALASNRTLIKDRYELDVGGYAAEVDVFQEALEGLILIEFEFRTEQERDSFTAPEVCLYDVTQEDFIAGAHLAGKTYADIEPGLARFDYQPLYLDRPSDAFS